MSVTLLSKNGKLWNWNESTEMAGIRFEYEYKTAF